MWSPWKNDRAERGAVKSFLFQCCSCLEKTNMIPTIAASKRLFRFCTSKILSFLRKEGTRKRCRSCGGSWGRTAERSQSTLPKFQGSVDERASHGFPTIQVKFHVLLVPFFKQKTVSRSSAPNARTVLMLIKDSSATLLSSATASWKSTGFQQTTHGIPTHKSWVSAVVTRRTWVELGSPGIQFFEKKKLPWPLRRHGWAAVAVQWQGWLPVSTANSTEA